MTHDNTAPPTPSLPELQELTYAEWLFAEVTCAQLLASVHRKITQSGLHLVGPELLLGVLAERTAEYVKDVSMAPVQVTLAEHMHKLEHYSIAIFDHIRMDLNIVGAPSGPVN